jgi:S1-C subfamily serine protease
MTKMFVGRRACCAALLGLVTLGSLLAVPGDADAVTKAAKAKAAKVRAPNTLKKSTERGKPKTVDGNLRFIGIQGKDVPGGGGCFVRAVSGRAAAAGVQPADIITQVENRPVTNTQEADDAVGDARAAGQDDVVLFVTDVNTGATDVPILVSLR